MLWETQNCAGMGIAYLFSDRGLLDMLCETRVESSLGSQYWRIHCGGSEVDSSACASTTQTPAILYP
jgi:hypothetical protein